MGKLLRYVELLKILFFKKYLILCFIQNMILKNKERQAINASVVQLIVITLYQRH